MKKATLRMMACHRYQFVYVALMLILAPFLFAQQGPHSRVAVRHILEMVGTWDGIILTGPNAGTPFQMEFTKNSDGTMNYSIDDDDLNCTTGQNSGDTYYLGEVVAGEVQFSLEVTILPEQVSEHTDAILTHYGNGTAYLRGLDADASFVKSSR